MRVGGLSAPSLLFGVVVVDGVVDGVVVVVVVGIGAVDVSSGASTVCNVPLSTRLHHVSKSSASTPSFLH